MFASFLVGLTLGALTVFLLSWAAHLTLLEDNRDLRCEVAEFRDREMDRLIADVALRCAERPTDSRVN